MNIIIVNEKNDCAFQYAKITGNYFRSTEIICDETGITLSEAKILWNKYYPDLAHHIKDGNTGEMVIWVNMEDEHAYRETLQHISTDADSDGISIWETQKNYFTKEFEIVKIE